MTRTIKSIESPIVINTNYTRVVTVHHAPGVQSIAQNVQLDTDYRINRKDKRKVIQKRRIRESDSGSSSDENMLPSTSKSLLKPQKRRKGHGQFHYKKKLNLEDV